MTLDPGRRSLGKPWKSRHMGINSADPTALPVVVIGAGIGGLSTAIYLAVAGLPVVVLEQNAAVGGKMGELSLEGFRWDTGPSVVTMRHVLEDLFATGGRRLEDALTLQPVEPLTRYFYPDGTILDATRDLTAMAEQIAAIEERDVEGYLAYLAYAAQLHRITGPVFIYDHPPTWRSFLRVPLADALRVDAWRNMDSKIESYVKSPQIRQLLGRFATYTGSSPYQASTTLNAIAHVELTGGVWYPQGGVYAIARALADLAAQLGVDIQLNCAVRQIEVENRQVRGVRVSRRPVREVLSEEVITARAVVANVDVATVYRRLLPQAAFSSNRLDRLEREEPSCSGFILLLGVQGQYPELAHHNIFFSSNYRREFDDIFQRGMPPKEPTIYVAITSKTDPSHAPPGCENWFVLVNAPALARETSPDPGPAEVTAQVGPQVAAGAQAGFDWTAGAGHYRELVLDRLAQQLQHHGISVDLRERLLVEKTLTPLDLARRTGAWRGALYGMSFNSALAPFRRPSNRAPDVAGLYFAGGTTHPGGGVPMVMLSGKVAAEMLLQDLGRGRGPGYMVRA